MYKFILFDADDTLFDYTKAEKSALKNAFVHCNLKYDADFHLPIYQKHNQNAWREHENNLISTEELKIRRFSDLFEEVGVQIDAKEFSIIYMEKLAESHYLFDGVTDLIKLIAPKYKIAIITNGLKEVQYKRIELSAISEYIETIIISEEAGAQKPEKQIFDYAFDKANHQNKNDTLIVGDNIKCDIKGGLDYGIDACWLNLYKVDKPIDINPTYEIFDIKELKTVLKL